MSFSYDTKNEICRLNISRNCCAKAEAYGILLYCNTFSPYEIRIVTENPNFASRLPKLFQKAFSMRFDRYPEKGQAGKLVFQITDQDKIAHILDALGFDPMQTVVLHVNFAMLEEPCCRAAFLRGAFFAGGSMMDPNKRYHMELVTSHLQVSREMASLLLEMEYIPKSVVRMGNYVTYFKQSQHIEELLTLIGARSAAMDVMNAKMEKELRNKVNRRMNCDTANVDKAVIAAQEQVEAIAYLRDHGVLETLPEKLQETARLREENAFMALSELAEEFNPPMTKSGLSHRLRKLMELYKKTKEDETNESL
ncbi:DNA-binding protein WhiA [Bengtsoniella intestinalis]|uniref:DNA-binding protein WhiA n=1 Tax=Bengtsoniella intestinalis TaxID=3073143 RepID=UPI00391F49F6